MIFACQLFEVMPEVEKIGGVIRDSSENHQISIIHSLSFMSNTVLEGLVGHFQNSIVIA